MKLSIKIVTAFLAVVALAHLLRVIFQWKVSFNGAELPQWMSAVACLVVGGLALWLWQDHKA